MSKDVRSITGRAIRAGSPLPILLQAPTIQGSPHTRLPSKNFATLDYQGISLFLDSVCSVSRTHFWPSGRVFVRMLANNSNCPLVVGSQAKPSA